MSVRELLAELQERGKMESLLKQLCHPPWRVLAGELYLLQLTILDIIKKP